MTAVTTLAPQPCCWRMDPVDSFSDYTIEVVDDAERMGDVFHVHRNILALGPRASGYFAGAFRSRSLREGLRQSSRIALTDGQREALPYVLDYMYRDGKLRPGDAPMEPAQVLSVVRLADYLQVPGVAAELTRHVSSAWSLNDLQLVPAFLNVDDVPLQHWCLKSLESLVERTSTRPEFGEAVRGNNLIPVLLDYLQPISLASWPSSDSLSSQTSSGSRSRSVGGSKYLRRVAQDRAARVVRLAATTAPEVVNDDSTLEHLIALLTSDVDDAAASSLGAAAVAAASGRSHAGLFRAAAATLATGTTQRMEWVQEYVRTLNRPPPALPARGFRSSLSALREAWDRIEPSDRIRMDALRGMIGYLRMCGDCWRGCDATSAVDLLLDEPIKCQNASFGRTDQSAPRDWTSVCNRSNVSKLDALMTSSVPPLDGGAAAESCVAASLEAVATLSKDERCLDTILSSNIMNTVRASAQATLDSDQDEEPVTIRRDLLLLVISRITRSDAALRVHSDTWMLRVLARQVDVRSLRLDAGPASFYLTLDDLISLWMRVLDCRDAEDPPMTEAVSTEGLRRLASSNGAPVGLVRKCAIVLRLCESNRF